MPDQRKSKRHFIYNGARLVATDGAELGTCRVIDISKTGARLETQAPAKLPEHFILLLSYDGSLRRQCVVVWRSKVAVGVEFIPDNKLPSKASKAPPHDAISKSGK
jgi:hypothetical protein